ncbi:hypothetical protein ACFL54_08535 [Planctomycetota bacterium]
MDNYGKINESGIILVDIASFTSEKLKDQVEKIKLLNEVIQIALDEDSVILKDQWSHQTVNKGTWRVSKKIRFTSHNTGDGYFLVCEKYDKDKVDGEGYYCKTILHAACAIRDWILQLNVSENKGYHIGTKRGKLNFRMIVHYGEYSTPEGLKLGGTQGSRLLIGDGLNDSARMIALRGEGTLNTMYVSEQMYELLPVRWRQTYFDGSLLQQDDSKGKAHNFYKCIPPPAWECDYNTGEINLWK